MRDAFVSRRRLLRVAVAAGTGVVVTSGCGSLVPTTTTGAPAGEAPAGVPGGGSDGRFRQVDGAVNVRDFGGYSVEGQYTVARGRIYRSGSLHRVTEQGVGQLAALKLATVIDFRATGEAAGRPDKLPAGVTSVSAPVASPAAMGPPTVGLTKPEEKTLTEFRAFVSGAETRASYGAALRAVLAAGDRPTLWHCNSGTYRTGWGSAVLLTAIGVPRAQVYEDFLLSNAAFGATFAFPEYLDAAFGEVTNLYGSFDSYLDRGLGFGPDAQAQLRRALVV